MIRYYWHLWCWLHTTSRYHLVPVIFFFTHKHLLMLPLVIPTVLLFVSFCQTMWKGNSHAPQSRFCPQDCMTAWVTHIPAGSKTYRILTNLLPVTALDFNSPLSVLALFQYYGCSSKVYRSNWLLWINLTINNSQKETNDHITLHMVQGGSEGLYWLMTFCC